eukprot:gene16820-17001_t
MKPTRIIITLLSLGFLSVTPVLAEQTPGVQTLGVPNPKHTKPIKLVPVSGKISALLKRYPKGGPGLAADVQNLLVADPSLADEIIALVASANPAQKAAIARGVSGAVSLLQASNPDAAKLILAAAMLAGDPVFLAAIQSLQASNSAERGNNEGSRSDSGRGESSEALFFTLFIGGLAWVPFWLGSNRIMPWGINAVWFGSLTLLFEGYLLAKGRGHPVGLRTIFIPAVCFGAVICWIVVQNATFVPQTLQHPLWAMAADALDMPQSGSISINRDLTALSLLRLMTAACVFWLSLQLCRNAGRARLLVESISLIVAVYAAYGLFAAPLGSPIFWFDVATGETAVRSTFVNRNSFATYAGIGLICNLALVLRLYRRSPAGDASVNRFSHFIEVSGRKGLWLVSTAFLTLVALLLTGSRAGVIASVIGVIALFLLTFLSGRRRIRESLEAIGFLMAVVGGCFVFFGDIFAGRIASNGLVDADRMSVFQITVQSILDSPILGFGMGTFQDVFPIYRDRSISTFGTWDHAHNTYLEVFQGLGLIFGSLLLVSMAYLLFLCLRGVAKRRQSVMACCVAVAVFALVAIHALADFSFEIQAVALTAIALLGAGVAQSQSSQLNETQREENTGLKIPDILNFFWRQWKLIGGIALAVMLVGAVVLSRQIPVYTSTTQVLLDPRKEKAAGQDSIMSDGTLDMPAIESQLSIIRSSVLLRRVVEKEHLINDGEFGAAPVVTSWSISSAVKSVFSSSNIPDQKPSNPDQSAAQMVSTIENLKSALVVKRGGQGYVIEISVTSADPIKVARLTNDVADAFVVDKLDARFDAAKRASGWLTDRLEDLRKQLHESEQAVADFRSQNNLTQTNGAATLNQDQLGQLNSRLVTARSETADKKASLDLIASIKAKGGSLSSLPDVVASPAIIEFRKQEADASRREADLLARYSDRHPAVINVRAELSDIRRGMAAELQRIAANTENAYQLALSRQAAVEGTLRDVTGMSNLDGNKAIELRELERTAAVNKSLFEDFLQRARITEEQSTFESRDARIISPAIPSGSPSAPKRSLWLLGALVLGLMIGVGAAFGAEQINAGFTTSRQMEDMLEVPMLASISRMSAKDLLSDGKPILLPLLPALKPLSRISEAVRALRSGVQMSDVDHPPKVIQFTSTIPGEGKTTLALTFASSAAQSGLRVILIDGDLRHPSSSRFFGHDKDKGLVDYLVGDASLESIVKFEESTRFWILPAGSKTQNPPDLLASERWKSLIELLRSKFDLVIVDTPPMGPVIDPSVVAQVVDKVVFVVRWSSTARELVQQAVQQLNVKKKVAGVVFNQVNDALAQKYGKYAYAYYYGARYYKRYYSEDT